MNTNQFVILAGGIAIGVDVALLVHFGERIWDDYQDRRAIRRHTAALDARLDAAHAKVDAALAKATGGHE